MQDWNRNESMKQLQGVHRPGPEEEEEKEWQQHYLNRLFRYPSRMPSNSLRVRTQGKICRNVERFRNVLSGTAKVCAACRPQAEDIAADHKELSRGERVGMFWPAALFSLGMFFCFIECCRPVIE